MDKKPPLPNLTVFPSAAEDAARACAQGEDTCAQTTSPAYQLAFSDLDFIMRDQMRPVRLMLELSKPELCLNEHKIEHTVVIFGSARLQDRKTAQCQLKQVESKLHAHPSDPVIKKELSAAKAQVRNAEYYEESKKMAQLVSQSRFDDAFPTLHVITGGGPGIMEAANRGAHEENFESIGLNIILPKEQRPNPYITPSLCFRFHYFAMRKMHFLMRARALIAFPGGFGTLDELFETLTLIQTKKIKPIPVLIFGKDYWQKLINFDLLVEEGMINEEDLSLFQFVDSATEAWEILQKQLTRHFKD